MIIDSKVCTKCNTLKNISMFHRCKKSPLGVRSICKECRKNENSLRVDYRNNYYNDNKEIILLKSKKYKEKNKEHYLLMAKQYRENNKEKVRISKLNSTKKRKQNDSFFRLIIKLRKYLRRYVKNPSHNYSVYLGCTPHELKIYLETKFDSWMSWDNYGYGENKWVIDHIIPLSSSNNEHDLYKLCHYSNLQPLGWKENLIKSNKINYAK
jgi:hypothetical protein